MAQLNANLKDSVGEGENLKFFLDFDGWTPGGLTSDLVHDGIYEALVVSCKPKTNKRDDGINAVTVLKITGPSCPEKGKQLVAYHPVPQGDLKSPENAKRRFLHNLFASIVSGVKGTPAAEALKGAGVREFTFKSFVGRTCYVKVRETTDNNARPVGEIQFYVMKSQYEEAPGPFGGTGEATSADIAASAAAAVDNPAATAKPAEAAKPAASGNPLDDLLGV
jgi:hypothetical protein